MIETANNIKGIVQSSKTTDFEYTEKSFSLFITNMKPKIMISSCRGIIPLLANFQEELSMHNYHS